MQVVRKQTTQMEISSAPRKLFLRIKRFKRSSYRSLFASVNHFPWPKLSHETRTFPAPNLVRPQTVSGLHFFPAPASCCPARWLAERVVGENGCEVRSIRVTDLISKRFSCLNDRQCCTRSQEVDLRTHTSNRMALIRAWTYRDPRGWPSGTDWQLDWNLSI